MVVKRKTCVDCHFLACENATHRLPSRVKTEWRNDIKKDDFVSLLTYDPIGITLFCYKKCWYGTEDDRYYEIVQKERHDCFFTKFRPGMLFAAGEELEKRERDYQEAKEDRRMTQYGLFIAGISIALDFIFTGLSLKIRFLIFGVLAVAVITTLLLDKFWPEV